MPEWLTHTSTLEIGGAMLWAVLALVTMLWTLGDAEQRARAGCAVALLVGLTWPVGFLVWLVFRPSRS
jgi:hypothetical protein